MNANTLCKLMTQRRNVLAELLELGRHQIDVIAAGRMSELMALLAQKQRPLQQLAEICHVLREAAQEDPQQRRWDSETQRQQCREDQEQCEQMHVELLAIEAQCETALQESRETLQQRISRLDSAHQAANQYANCDAGPTVGARLDLSSN